jgi:hypothetical protein
MKHRLLLTAMFAALWEFAWWLLNRDRNLWAKAHASYAWTGCEQ